MRKAEDEGWDLYLQDDYEGALKKFDEAIKWNPRNSDAYRKKGSALNFLENWDLAIEACQHAIQLDSKNHGHTMYYLKCTMQWPNMMMH